MSGPAPVEELERDLNAVTAELVDVQDPLVAVYNLAGALRGYLEQDPLLAALLGEAARLVGATGGFASLGDPDSQPVTLPGLSLDASEVRRLVQLCGTGTEVMVQRVPSIGRLMLVPMPVHDRPSAVLGLVRASEASFTAPEQKLMAAIAAYGGAQLEGVLLHQESLLKARVELEFELARSIQADLSPALPAGYRGVDVYAESRAAHVIGGDFFDFGRRDEERLMCVLGDVAGKGVPAALLVAMTRSIIRASSRGLAGSVPRVVLQHANVDLYQDFSQLSRFATVFLASYDPTTRELLSANAGHSPVIHKAVGGRAELLYPGAVPLGVLPDWDGDEESVRLDPGDVLVVTTDGFNESEDPRTGEFFGCDRLLELVDQVAAQPAADIAAALFRANDEFAGGAEADDDRTVLVLRGTP